MHDARFILVLVVVLVLDWCGRPNRRAQSLKSESAGSASAVGRNTFRGRGRRRVRERLVGRALPLFSLEDGLLVQLQVRGSIGCDFDFPEKEPKADGGQNS